MKLTILPICLAFCIISSVSGYCDLCDGHIACGNDGNFASTCPSDAQIVALGVTQRNVLLNAHNSYRNNLAGGLVANFPTASRMNTLVWDAELAMLAELNVKQCEMMHDQCRDTETFRFAGQNLYIYMTSGNFGPIEDQLEGAVESWFREYLDASPDDIATCCGGDNFSNIGHFLQLAQDRTTHIGCAAARFSTDWRTTLIACNYSWGNLLDEPVYVTGPPGFDCPNDRNQIFTNLCA